MFVCQFCQLWSVLVSPGQSWSVLAVLAVLAVWQSSHRDDDDADAA